MAALLNAEVSLIAMMNVRLYQLLSASAQQVFQQKCVIHLQVSISRKLCVLFLRRSLRSAGAYTVRDCNIGL